MSLCASTLVRLSKGYAPVSLVQRVTKGCQLSQASRVSTTAPMMKTSGAESFMLRHQEESSKTSNRDWIVLRVGSVGLLASLAGSFIVPGNAVIDFVAVSLLAHHTWTGIDHILGDYLPLFTKPWFVSMAKYAWFIISLISLGLMYSFNYNGAGFSNALYGFFKL